MTTTQNSETSYRICKKREELLLPVKRPPFTSVWKIHYELKSQWTFLEICILHFLPPSIPQKKCKRGLERDSLPEKTRVSFFVFLMSQFLKLNSFRQRRKRAATVEQRKEPKTAGGHCTWRPINYGHRCFSSFTRGNASEFYTTCILANLVRNYEKQGPPRK